MGSESSCGWIRFFPTLTTPSHAIHHWARRRFTSTGDLSHPWKIVCLVTQRSSKNFYRKESARRLTTRNPDGSLADFQKALRVRLNISKNEPLVIKQMDGDYTLDIETGSFLVGLCVLVLLLSRMRGQRRSMRLSAILPNLLPSCTSQSMEV